MKTFGLKIVEVLISLVFLPVFLVLGIVYQALLFAEWCEKNIYLALLIVYGALFLSDRVNPK